MNEDILKGKWKKLKGENKIWWGHHTGDVLTELDGNKDKLLGWLQEKKGMNQADAEKAIEKLNATKKSMEDQSEEVLNKIKAHFDKLTYDEIAEIDGDVGAWTEKVKEKYQDSQEEAVKKIKDFINQFSKDK